MNCSCTLDKTAHCTCSGLDTILNECDCNHKIAERQGSTKVDYFSVLGSVLAHSYSPSHSPEECLCSFRGECTEQRNQVLKLLHHTLEPVKEYISAGLSAFDSGHGNHIKVN